MTKKKTETAVEETKEYEVLIPCFNEKTGKGYGVGDAVTTDDFAQAIINNWLKKGVLGEVQ